MSIYFEYEANTILQIPYEEIITKVVETATEFEECPYETQINVILTDNNEIMQINMDYRDIKEPTDVLSFPMIDFKTPSDFSDIEEHIEDCFDPESGELLLGDIIISVDKVLEQADKYGHTIERELAFLTAHSMLHLFGYDHIENEDRELMELKQESILNLLDYTRNC